MDCQLRNSLIAKHYQSRGFGVFLFGDSILGSCVHNSKWAFTSHLSLDTYAGTFDNICLFFLFLARSSFPCQQALELHLKRVSSQGMS